MIHSSNPLTAMKISTPSSVVLMAACLGHQVLSATPQRFDHGNPTNYEQLLLELVNKARANPEAEAARLKIGLNDNLPKDRRITTTPKQPLPFHPALIAASRAHSKWMVDNDIFSHTGANNSDGGDRMEKFGFVFSGAFAWGENISGVWEPEEFDLVKMTHDTHDGLFRSPTHRPNICGEQFAEIGIGLHTGEFLENKKSMLGTQNFAASSKFLPDPWLLGVVFLDADKDGTYDAGEGIPGVTVTLADGSWDAVTSSSGGYAVPCAGFGSLDVTFSGGPLAQAVVRTINRKGKNLKVDVVLTPPPASPEISVSQPKSTILVDGSSKREFGTAVRGKKGMVREFTISNVGNAALKSLKISVSGTHSKDFLVSQPSKKSLNAGDTTKFKVTFTPKAGGNRTATVRIRSNDKDENPFDIPVNGVGLSK